MICNHSAIIITNNQWRKQLCNRLKRRKLAVNMKRCFVETSATILCTFDVTLQKSIKITTLYKHKYYGLD